MLWSACTAQPFLPGQNLLPNGKSIYNRAFTCFQGKVPSALTLSAGNIRTVDNGGPYDFSQLGTQVTEIKGAAHACIFQGITLPFSAIFCPQSSKAVCTWQPWLRNARTSRMQTSSSSSPMSSAFLLQ